MGWLSSVCGRERQSASQVLPSARSFDIDELAPLDDHMLMSAPRAYVHEIGHRWVEFRLIWARTMGV